MATAERILAWVKPKIVYYTFPGFLDPTFSMLAQLSKYAEIHLFVEVSPEGRGSGPFPIPPTRLRRGIVKADELIGWLPNNVNRMLHDLASFHLVVYTDRRAFSPGNLFASWQAARFIHSIHPQIIHFDGASSRAATLPYLVPNTPLVLGIHDSQPHTGEKGGRFELIRKLFLRRARVVVFHSQYSREIFPDFSLLRSEKVHTYIIPLGVYDIFRDDCDSKADRIDDLVGRTVLFFGRISPYKGIEVLLSAAHLIAEKITGFHLIIAGVPIPGYQLPDPPQLGNGGICEYRLHHIAAGEMKNLFEGAALVVLPYLDASQSSVLSNAYAYHKPVVASAVGGIPEMIEDGITGRLVPPANPQALAATIVELLLDNEKRQRMADAIQRKEQGELSWSRLVSMTLDIYQRAIDRK